jgi:2-polyprenyl-6-methoxyphenol hydroxylase-like FAD-dependent oxidoreductase
MPRALIGGSLSGLFAGTLLRSIGWDACMFERSPHELDNRSGSIVLQPDVTEAFRRAGVPFRRAGVPYVTSIGVVAKERVGQRIRLQQILTSWSTLYNAMRARWATLPGVAWSTRPTCPRKRPRSFAENR